MRVTAFGIAEGLTDEAMSASGAGADRQLMASVISALNG